MTTNLEKSPSLFVFGGLPGVGKSTLARPLAQHLGAAYLRIDSIEQALRASGAIRGEMGPVGYEIAYALAEDNLRFGRNVVADSVNPIAVTRDAWRGVAEKASAALVEIEVVCADRNEHRRRVEMRYSDIAGLLLPTWREVEVRQYEPWDRPHIVIDTAGKDAARALTELERALSDRT